MAKLKAPLLSLGAAGAIGKSIVYFPWKGIDAVREYVIPSNPKTAAQNTQRGYVTAVVAKIHAAMAAAANALSEADKMAYALLASAFGITMTWFNCAVKVWVDGKVDGFKGVIYRCFTVSDVTISSIDLIVYLSEETGSTLAAGKFYFGPSKTSLIYTKTATITPGASAALVNQDCSAFMTDGVEIYVQFKPDTADLCEGAVSGIYHFTPTTA